MNRKVLTFIVTVMYLIGNLHSLLQEENINVSYNATLPTQHNVPLSFGRADSTATAKNENNRLSKLIPPRQILVKTERNRGNLTSLLQSDLNSNDTTLTIPLRKSIVIQTNPETTSTSISTSTTESTTVPQSTTTPEPTTTSGSTTTNSPPTSSTTQKPGDKPCKKFDGPSFVGGVVLTMGMLAIAFVAYKFYKARNERNYHTL